MTLTNHQSILENGAAARQRADARCASGSEHGWMSIHPHSPAAAIAIPIEVNDNYLDRNARIPYICWPWTNF